MLKQQNKRLQSAVQDPIEWAKRIKLKAVRKSVYRPRPKELR